MPLLMLSKEKISFAFSEPHDLNSPDFSHYETVTENLHCHCRHSNDLHLNSVCYQKVQDLSGSSSYHTSTYW